MRWPGASVVPINVVSCGLFPTPIQEFVLAGREGAVGTACNGSLSFHLSKCSKH